jgi:hypothetical protein
MLKGEQVKGKRSLCMVQGEEVTREALHGARGRGKGKR